MTATPRRVPCYRCGLRSAALPLACCIECWAGTRHEDATALVGVPEIASRAGTLPDTVRKWSQRYTSFPHPVLTLAAGKIWRWSEVEEWLTARQNEGAH